MNQGLVVVVFLLFSFFSLSSAEKILPKELACSKPSPIPIESLILSPEPHTYVSPDELPILFDWRNVAGTVFVTSIRNQIQPKACGSCWAFGTTSSYADRMKIMLGAQTTDVIPSVQVLLDCGELHGAGNCNGGSFKAALKFISDFGITDETCSPYLAVDQVIWSETPCQYTMCRTCEFSTGDCFNVNATSQYYVSEYGTLPPLNVSRMMTEIYARGPIVCSMYAHSEGFLNYKGGIINDTTVYPYTTHDISITGWGTSESGVDYWIVRNSFGTIWGLDGWFLIERGINCLLIESSCGWGVPKFANEDMRIEFPLGRNALARNIKFQSSTIA